MMRKNRVRRFDKPPGPPPPVKPEEAREIDYEICWCIEKLENMIVKSSSDKDVKQCQLSLKLLKNPETPLVRKRQLMRQHFGDYKKTIAATKKNALNKSNVKIEFKNNDGGQSGLVRKKQERGNIVDMDSCQNVSSKQNAIQNEKKICGIQLSDNSFRFNF